jgi:hypothetical protein
MFASSSNSQIAAGHQRTGSPAGRPFQSSIGTAVISSRTNAAERSGRTITSSISIV